MRDVTAPVLRVGDNCWRIAPAGRMTVIVDAEDYFSHLRTALLSARHSVLLVGWDFDTRIALDRDDDRDHAGAAKPNKVSELLRHAVTLNPKLEIYILRWDLAFLEMPFCSTTFRFLFDWLVHNRIHFRLDGHHPAEACHHQKIAVIDDALAFCGGIDITMDRWDTRAHRDDEPGRRRPDGKAYRPWHDATVAVDGAAAKSLGDLARERWTPAVPPPGLNRWPTDLEPGFDDVAVAIARTRAAYEGAPEVREIEALYLAAIASARRSIYLEGAG